MKLIQSELNSNHEYKTKNDRKGFTLIEMLVVIFVVGIGLVGVLSFFNINVNNQSEAKNELIASHLAQEEMDLLRNLADYNRLNFEDWYKEITHSSSGASNCTSLDVQSLTDHKCETGNADRAIEVCQNQLNGRYYQCGNVAPGDRIATVFSRRIDIVGKDVSFPPDAIVDLNAGDCLLIKTTVGWPNTDSMCNSDTAQCPKKTIATGVLCKPRE